MSYLYYNRFRYYDCESGVYISQDPIGLKGGMPNLYSYVYDINLMVDQLGLAGVVTSTLTVIKDGVKKTYTAKSRKATLTGPLGDIVQSVKDDLSAKNLSEPFHGHCGEIRAIRKALDDGFELKDLQGATMKSINTKTGEIEKACDCCAGVMEKLDIKETIKCH